MGSCVAWVRTKIRLHVVISWLFSVSIITLYLKLTSTSSCTKSIIACQLLAVTYVGSLYVWTSAYPRDHPSTIKRRFISVFVVSILSPLFVVLFQDDSSRETSVLEQLGLRTSGMIKAALLPLVLTMVLFAGPLVLHLCDGVCLLYFESRYWTSNLRNLIWLRNHFVAPLSEEFTFRACMLPLLTHCFSHQCVVFVCPLFFGVAHLHHLSERLRAGIDLKRALLGTFFQFAYTTVFGTYSAFLFVRTGHLLAPFVAHAFCNHMGFPDFGEVMAHPQPKRTAIVATFVLGLAAWCYLLFPLTTPSIYNNTLV